MAKYGELASSQVKSAVHRQKTGTLESSSGDVVTSRRRAIESRRRAIAIGLSETRAKRGKVPKVPPRRARR